tara:strand:+ start:114 stop:1232 length:1119 start_codon:yes stop_codon:yes gene_type:complete
MRPEQAFSDRSGTTGGQPLQNQMPPPLRLPEEDRAWAREFINNLTAADDDEGLQQVVADYGGELDDLPRRKALREELMTVLHRKAEVEKMPFDDYIARITAMDEAPLEDDRGKAGQGEFDVAAAPLAIPFWLWVMAGSAGVVGTTDALNPPGRNRSRSMMPGDPPPQLPPSRPAESPDHTPLITPAPKQEGPPTMPGGGPSIASDIPPFPDQRDALPNYTTLNITTKHGDRFFVSGLLTQKDEMRIRNFIDASPSPEMSKTLSEMAGGQKVSMVKEAGSHLVNVDRSGGREQWKSDFERIREIHGVPESKVKAYPNGTLVFVTPDGSSVNRRIRSSNGHRTVEIQVNYPATEVDGLLEGKKVKPGLKLRYVE